MWDKMLFNVHEAVAKALMVLGEARVLGLPRKDSRGAVPQENASGHRSIRRAVMGSTAASSKGVKKGYRFDKLENKRCECRTQVPAVVRPEPLADRKARGSGVSSSEIGGLET